MKRINRQLDTAAERSPSVELTGPWHDAKIEMKGVMVMLDQAQFGMRLRERRRMMGLRQSDIAGAMRVTEQAISKWEHGESLPDLNNLILLASVLRVSVDELLDVGSRERMVKRIQVGGAVMELVQRPEMLLAGKILHARDFGSYEEFDAAIGRMSGEAERAVYARVRGPVLPVRDIHLSVNFWLPEETRAYGFVRETTCAEQPEGIDLFRMPASLYLRGYADAGTARLLVKEKCEVWELFAYLRDYVMPAHGLRMARCGAQEMAVYDGPTHETGCACLPVEYE